MFGSEEILTEVKALLENDIVALSLTTIEAALPFADSVGLLRVTAFGIYGKDNPYVVKCAGSEYG